MLEPGPAGRREDRQGRHASRSPCRSARSAIAVPDLVGLELAAAKGELEQHQPQDQGGHRRSTATRCPRAWSSPPTRRRARAQAAATPSPWWSARAGPRSASPTWSARTSTTPAPQLQRLGLTAVEQYKDSDQPADTVIGQTPKAGTGAEKDAEIKLEVSKGPPLITVPDLTNQPCQQAQRHAAGDEPAGRASSFNPNGLVRSQNPGAEHPGAAADRGRRCSASETARIGSHTKTSGGLAKAALPYADAAGSEAAAGLRLQLARLGAAARRPEAGHAVPGRLRRARPARVHPRVAAGQPRLADRADGRALGRRRWRTRCERGRAIGATAVVFHAGSSVDADARRQGVAPAARGAAAAARRRGRARACPGCWSSRAPAAAAAWRRRSQDLGPYLDAVGEPPVAGRLLRHLPRLGGRPRPGHPRRHDRDPGRAGRHGRPGTACS